MKKETFDLLKNELLIIGLIFVVTFIAFKIIFLTENFFVVLRTVLAIFWLLVLPGYFIMFYWKEQLKFFERLIIGVAVGTAIIGLTSYYIGLLGLHIKYHTVLLPIGLILVGILSNRKR
ncbi:hypothetical protein HYX02_01220 [Candidatus Woesearchaeota archaeon]|nr:hypothetical protein [Candidatus Woesearchaeota archaeon]